MKITHIIRMRSAGIALTNLLQHNCAARATVGVCMGSIVDGLKERGDLTWSNANISRL